MSEVTETPTQQAAPAKAAEAPAELYTFRSLAHEARLSPPEANAVRVTLEVRKANIDKPCDRAAFKAAMLKVFPRMTGVLK